LGFDRASWVICAVADAPNYGIIVRNFKPPVDRQTLTFPQGDETNNTLGSFSKRSRPMTKRDSYTSFPLQELNELGKLFKKYFGYDCPGAVYTSLPNPFAGLIAPRKRLDIPKFLVRTAILARTSRN
jgi:hypothetical protein